MSDQPTPTWLPDALEELARTQHDLDQTRRELDTTRAEADQAIADLRQARTQLEHTQYDATAYRELAEVLIAAATVAPAPEPAPKVSCPDGFHWIGQSFARCDHCALPAWEHAGMAELPKDTPLFSGRATWVLRPWKPGEADAIRRKWEPDMTLAEVIAAAERPVDLDDRAPRPPARAFLGEPACGKPDCPCGGQL